MEERFVPRRSPRDNERARPRAHLPARFRRSKRRRGEPVSWVSRTGLFLLLVGIDSPEKQRSCFLARNV